MPCGMCPWGASLCVASLRRARYLLFLVRIPVRTHYLFRFETTRTVLVGFYESCKCLKPVSSLPHQAEKLGYYRQSYERGGDKPNSLTNSLHCLTHYMQMQKFQSVLKLTTVITIVECNNVYVRTTRLSNILWCYSINPVYLSFSDD